MEEMIGIKDIFRILLKRWKLIVIITMITSMISGMITYFVITPIYEGRVQILVNQKDSARLDVTQLRSNIELINTYSEIIKTPAILEIVKMNLELPESVGQLSSRITVNIQQNSQVFSLTVRDSNPGRAVEIANAVSQTFQKEIMGIMNVDNVSILAEAELPENPTPVNPKPLLNIAIAAVFGLMVGIGLAFLLEYLNHTIKDSHDAEAYLGITVLGSINKMTKKKFKNNSKRNKGVETLEG
ncbi:YveK family protein [Bacillus sp. CGMCC 1.16607]|uniref:YveK family protein n=1 Tax=Bacillus sp. CGMCC 1.16607 TaxID=3351842 RepID=UPI00362B27C3